MSDLYDHPDYYEIAFSWRDIPGEADLFEECFKRFSKITVKSVLELGCGNSPHMEELCKRGYEYHGLDLNRAMLEYSQKKANSFGGNATFICSDMIDFSVDKTVDFVYVLLGSLSAQTLSDLKKHFNSVAHALKKGGLYLLDWCVHFDPPWQLESGGSWEMERDGIKVKTTVSWKLLNRAEQNYEETLVQEIDDRGTPHRTSITEIKRAIFPQEFLLLVSSLDNFEFVGWWNNWNLDYPLDKVNKIDRPVVLLRRV